MLTTHEEIKIWSENKRANSLKMLDGERRQLLCTKSNMDFLLLFNKTELFLFVYYLLGKRTPKSITAIKVTGIDSSQYVARFPAPPPPDFYSFK